jgi:hypothetical protein
MPNLPDKREREDKLQRDHNNLKWLLTLLSAVITSGLLVLLNTHW